MGLLGNIVSYQLGKRSANRKRGRQERRAEFFREWNEINNPEPDTDDCDCDCEH